MKRYVRMHQMDVLEVGKESLSMKLIGCLGGVNLLDTSTVQLTGKRDNLPNKRSRISSALYKCQVLSITAFNSKFITRRSRTYKNSRVSLHTV